LAAALSDLAFSQLRMGEAAAAIDTYLAADKAYAALPRLSQFLVVRRTRNEIRFRLGEAKARLGQLDAAEKEYRTALADRQGMADRLPRTPNNGTLLLLQEEIGQSRMGLGDLLLMYRKDRRQAAAEYAICLDLFNAGLKADPDNLSLLQRLGATYYRLGLAATDPAKAHTAYAECLKLREELAKIDPKDTQSAIDLALAQARVGKHAEAGRTTTALLQQGANDRQVLFQVACALSVLAGTSDDYLAAERYRDEACQVLRRPVQGGWRDRGSLVADPDLDTIRDDPRFRDLLKTLP
jgi:tetratricopeptide (TPR) repeat protein